MSRKKEEKPEETSTMISDDKSREYKKGERNVEGRRSIGGHDTKRKIYTGGENINWAKRKRSCRPPNELPFLRGGNRKDPLNLESVKPVDEVETMKPLEIVIPKNLHDPLNLLNVNKKRAQRKRHNSRQKDLSSESPIDETGPRFRANTLPSTDKRRSSSTDPIVSPVPHSAMRKFTSSVKSSCESHKDQIVSSNHHRSKRQSLSELPEKPSSVDESSSTLTTSVDAEKTKCTERNIKKAKMNERFRFGNFDRYYGCRLETGCSRDPRLVVMKKEWFEMKSVLDIGCNAGYVTLSIAKDFEPRRIVGIDIDDHLVGVARKNIRHYCDQDIELIGKFPASFSLRYGPLSALPARISTRFPDNVWFRQENYVLETDGLLEMVKQEFDVILALSITKWVHLNWGDDGLKRFFRRAFLQLRPGGIFILEPQNFESYRKRSKMTPELHEKFQTLKFLPAQFQAFLIEDVGFQSCDCIDPPKAKTKGFERAIQIYHKRAPKSSHELRRRDGNIAVTKEGNQSSDFMTEGSAGEPTAATGESTKEGSPFAMLQ
ncbi:hypothetical protein AB6A40_004036 [Gnathostoma spinigerum]|uniref:RNA methyltransferase n=1 Tax=Gnathostoma spinigerum TaxID=75299 RepID=A0ABD6EKU8_9BILA